MKVVYFKRNARSPVHIHASSHASCFYVPDEKIVLYIEQHGTFGGRYYSLTDKAEILEEARNITEGNTPNVKNVTFSDIKEFEYESSKLRELMQNIRSKSELQTKVEAGIEDLLKQLK